MEFEDLPPEAQEAFLEVGREYARASVDPQTRINYVNGLEKSLENNDYARGLADKFNIPITEFAGVEAKWVESLSAEDYIIGLTNVGFDEQLSKRYAEAVLDQLSSSP